MRETGKPSLPCEHQVGGIKQAGGYRLRGECWMKI